MNDNKLINKALARLTKTQRNLLCLLSNEDVQAEEVTNFLMNYDIDNENAVTSFFINDLLDRFDISIDHCDAIPRIRGLKNYYRFHNASVIMNISEDELIVNPDLFLKIRYPEDIRPITAIGGPITLQRIQKLAGKKYCLELVNNANSIQHQTRTYLIPSDSYIVDLLYLNLRITLNYSEDKDRIFCNIYDIYRYCTNQKYSSTIGNAMTYSVVRKAIRKMLI